jgi:hypothetical protein
LVVHPKSNGQVKSKRACLRWPEEATPPTPQTCGRRLGRRATISAMEFTHNAQLLHRVYAILPALRS